VGVEGVDVDGLFVELFAELSDAGGLLEELFDEEELISGCISSEENISEEISSEDNSSLDMLESFVFSRLSLLLCDRELSVGGFLQA
jgi:hypothetical protein